MLLGACDRNNGQGVQMMLSPAQSQFKNTDVTGLDYGKDFAMPDHSGKMRTLADFKGKAVVVFFGYTQCPDVCPTTMTEMANVMQKLGPLSDKVQVLFVTVDPERDTPELLSKYVPAFDPRFLGLVGDKAATEKMAKEFRVFYQKAPGKEAGSYTMDHTASVFLLNDQGEFEGTIAYREDSATAVAKLRKLLES